jgi:hypothetical protein
MTVSINGTIYPTISDAINASVAGDTIDISAGTYSEDYPKIFHDLTIVGTGGLAHLTPVGQPSNGEAALVQDTANLTLDHIEISGVTVPDGNGAGVRFESGTTLTLTDDWMHDNENGVLTSGVLAGATVDITNSEFSNNGNEAGNTHNIYIGEVAQLTVTGSYFHDAKGGHEVKSRAENNTITNSRLQDGTADTSYQLDLPNGGNAVLNGDVLEKGVNASNGAVIHYGGELSPVYASSSLTIENCTIIDSGGHGRLFLFNQSVDGAGNPIVPVITNNTFYGITEADLSDHPVIESGNTFLPLSDAPSLDTSHPFLVPCFLRGTLISTINGDKRVEDLQIGDRVLTLVGGCKRVKWIGQRHISAEDAATNPNVRPVVISPDAIADGFPRRTLYVSPEHCLYIDGMLIQAVQLVNGGSICRSSSGDEIDYFHIELATHSVVFAEGMPCESWLDTGNRNMFDNVVKGLQRA